MVAALPAALHSPLIPGSHAPTPLVSALDDRFDIIKEFYKMLRERSGVDKIQIQ